MKLSDIPELPPTQPGQIATTIEHYVDWLATKNGLKYYHLGFCCEYQRIIDFLEEQTKKPEAERVIFLGQAYIEGLKTKCVFFTYPEEQRKKIDAIPDEY